MGPLWGDLRSPGCRDAEPCLLFLVNCHGMSLSPQGFWHPAQFTLCISKGCQVVFKKLLYYLVLWSLALVGTDTSHFSSQHKERESLCLVQKGKSQISITTLNQILQFNWFSNDKWPRLDWLSASATAEYITPHSPQQTNGHCSIHSGL